MKLQRNLEIENKSKSTVERLQEEKLLAHIEHCKKNSPYYQNSLADLNTTGTEGLHALLDCLPFTDKHDIELHNDAMCAVDPDDIVDIVMSSGTTGKPTKVMYSEHDLTRLAYNEEKSFLACGLSSSDTVLLTCTIDRCFVAGLAYFLGIRNIGASAIRNGHGSMVSHLEIIKRLNPTAIVGVPTFVRKLGQYMAENGFDPAKTAVTKIICIGEPIRDREMELVKVGKDIEEIWEAHVFSTYASSETVTTFCECTEQKGGHLLPDLAIVEIIDDEGKRVNDGDVGEVVVTPLDVEGMPLLRFKTGDMSFILSESCSCGRNSIRLGPILGRKKQMLKVKGTTVYPQAVFEVLAEMDDVSEYYVSVDSSDGVSDSLKVHVSLKNDKTTKDDLEEILQARLRVRPEIEIEPEKELRKKVYLPEFRKPMRFKDLR